MVVAILTEIVAPDVSSTNHVAEFYCGCKSLAMLLMYSERPTYEALEFLVGQTCLSIFVHIATQTYPLEDF